MLLQGDICRLHQGDFRGVREWWRENTARHGWNNKLFGRKLQVLKGCLLWPKRNLLHSSTFYHKMSANRSQIEKPPRRQKVKHNFWFSEILTPTATRRTKRRVESQVYSDWKKSIEESWVVISPNMIFDALSTGFGFAIWARSKTSINSRIMSYDTYGLLACGAYALIARSQSWLTHIQGFHIVWWPGVLDHAQYSISRTYNLLQTTMSPKRWTQRVVPSWLNVTARCSFEGFAFDSSGTGASSSEVLVDLLAPGTTLGGSDKVGFGCWEHIPTQDAGRKWRSDLRYRRQQVSDWWLTGIPETHIWYLPCPEITFLQKALAKKKSKPNVPKLGPWAIWVCIFRTNG